MSIQDEAPLQTTLINQLEELIAAVTMFNAEPTGQNRANIQRIKARFIDNVLYPDVAPDKELAKLKARFNNPTLSFTRVHTSELFAEAYRLEREASIQRRLNDQLTNQLKDATTPKGEVKQHEATSASTKKV